MIPFQLKRWPQKWSGSSDSYPLVWEPRPYLGTVDHWEGEVCPHPEPENPKARLFLAVNIPTVQFQRHGRFTPTPDSRTRTIFDCLPDPPVIYLVAETDDIENVFVMAAPFKTPMLIGKLHRNSKLYFLTIKAFGQLVTELKGHHVSS